MRKTLLHSWYNPDIHSFSMFMSGFGACNFLLIMTIFKQICIVGLLTFPQVTAMAQSNDALERAIYERDFIQIFNLANQSSENEIFVIDALCNDIDLKEYSYEQLLSYQDISQSSVINRLLSNVITLKEVEILEELSNLTAEQFYNYSIAFPQRQDILRKFFDEVVMPNVKNLSVQELVYYTENLPESYRTVLMAEIESRTGDIADILTQSTTDYKKYESKLSERVKYLLETIIWTYYVEGHKQLNEAYAQIGIVPDDPYAAADQYQRLVTACFPVSHIQRLLQEEVDEFYEELNQAREAYYKTAGKSTVPKLNYQVPQLTLKANASVDPLREIAAARERFIRNRETVSTGTSVLGWVFGPLTGLITQGIGDWLAIDGLVESEFNARKEYMESVQKCLLTSFANYSNSVVSGFDKSLK
ncbi:MAG: hypothetical protein K2H79_02620 [Bacteroidaceae bacterium]|nr:hypothetical protein [Bacteroidaceae bacterium]